MTIEYVSASTVEESLKNVGLQNEEVIYKYIGLITSKLRKALSKNYYKPTERELPVHIKEDLYVTDEELHTVCRLYKGNGQWKDVYFERSTVNKVRYIKFYLCR